MNNNYRFRISLTLQTITIIPLLLFGLVILLVGNYWFSKTMYIEIEQELKHTTDAISAQFNSFAPGDYHLEEEGQGLRLYKGDVDITNNHSFVDQFKASTGIDITLYYQDTRILTTLFSSEGTRMVGTAAPDKVLNEVFKSGTPHFYHYTLINNQSYFAYYTPVINSDGTVVGMVFAGRPSAEIDKAVQRSVYPLVVADVIAIIIISIGISVYMRKFASTITKIADFLTEVSDGNLSCELHPSVLRRNDEIGYIGKLVLSTQRSLRNMVETDTLTQLPNRRSADRKLAQIIDKCKDDHASFCVVIGDIDYFKKVNDTYGHDCGDLILRASADTLKSHMNTCGFASRWGGEEFMLVFDHMNIAQTVDSLKVLLDKIRSMENEFEGNIINVTMTFGAVQGDSDSDVKELFHIADEKLYEGKANGRNQIVS